MKTFANIRRYIYDNHWLLGFITTSMEGILRGDDLSVQWVHNTPNTSWFADPFILEVTGDSIILLVEEFPYSTRKGRISRVKIKRSSYSIVSVDPILELETHLSFPAIMRKNEKIYVYPENSASGQLNLYEYDESKRTCINEKLVCNRPLADATLVSDGDSQALFSTEVPFQNSSVLNKYVLVNGLYEKDKEFIFDSNIARNAGDWFIYKGQMYRPAQDCTHAYGGAVILQKIIKDNNGDYIFENIRRIDSSHPSYNLGCHTFNHYKGITVIDVNGYRRPIIANVMKGITKKRQQFLK